MKITITFILLTLLMSCTENKAQKKEVSNAEFVLSDCGGSYKGKPLPFGRPIEEWEKLFGKPTRKQYNAVFIWDNLGVIIENNETTKDDEYSPDYEIRRYDQLYIFFSNLDSPEGQKGNLKFANGRKSENEILKQYTVEELKSTGVEERVRIRYAKNGENYKSNYIYPYKQYTKSISIDGSAINPGMSLKELNKNRKSKDLEILSFRDNNLDGNNQWGDTKEEDGEYWNNEKRDMCPSKSTFTRNIAQFSNHELEFIKVEYYDKKENK
ncbi:DUF7738 domain-containing protein [Kaistella jeonii]|uniref:DUF7738 domain-containing protein n=1 Tax=Kaistella jeonii TaxID=266749 RepID=A0A0C1FBQ4_9FLAO|nr:hypothetical protein [Kaistella jeonii]KIA85459.1 hypothetical protein OA86_14775 [Kaistella jeonii]SFC43611.1 hypothetical protein SAMN05421876_1237 [Kaistella jeonii]VEI96792.1 Uncharacterised protein [Kaistella jeonii]